MSINMDLLNICSVFLCMFSVAINKRKVYPKSLGSWLFTIFRVTVQTTLNYRAMYYLQAYMAVYIEKM